MKYRRLGRTGLMVSEIGYGAWGIGGTSWIGAEDDTSIRSLIAARDTGINFFDTALAYGKGRSEKLLAQVFGDSREVIIATKVPPKNGKWPVPPGTPLAHAFPKHHVLQCLQTSLSNLGRKQIDLVQYHVWSDEWADDAGWLGTVETIRSLGLGQFVGISVNDHEPENVLRALESGLIDVVQVIYNIFDQSPEDRLFPYCQERNVGVIARVPFDEGSLTGTVRPDTFFPEGDFRNQYFAGNRKQQMWDRVRLLTRDADISSEALPELALRFCISHPAVATVIPGMRTPQHVHHNAAVSEQGPLDERTRKLLRKHRWSRNFYTQQTSMVEKLKAGIRRVAKV